MMRAYSTLAGAMRAAQGRPIIRLLADPDDLFVIVPDLRTQLIVMTAGSPHDRHQFAGSTDAMAILDTEIMKGEM